MYWNDIANIWQQICSHVVWAICFYSDFAVRFVFANRYMHAYPFIYKCMQIVSMQMLFVFAGWLAGLHAMQLSISLGCETTKVRRTHTYTNRLNWNQYSNSIQDSKLLHINTQSAISTLFFSLSMKLKKLRWNKKNSSSLHFIGQQNAINLSILNFEIEIENIEWLQLLVAFLFTRTLTLTHHACTRRVRLYFTPEFRMGTIKWFLFLLREKEETQRHELHSFAIKCSLAVRKTRMHIKSMSTLSVQFIFILKIIYINFTVAGAFFVGFYFCLCGGMTGESNNMHESQFRSILKEQWEKTATNRWICLVFFAFSVMENKQRAWKSVCVWEKERTEETELKERKIKREASSCAFICHIFLCVHLFTVHTCNPEVGFCFTING